MVRLRQRNGSLVSDASARLRVEVIAGLASANDTLAVDAADGLCTLDERAVLAFTNAEAAAAGLTGGGYQQNVLRLRYALTE